MGPVPEQAMNFPKRPQISRGKNYQPCVQLRRQAASRSRKKQAAGRAEAVPVGGVLHALGGGEERIRLPPPEALRHGAGSGPSRRGTDSKRPGGRDEGRGALRDSARRRIRALALRLWSSFLEAKFVWLVSPVACCDSVALRLCRSGSSFFQFFLFRVGHLIICHSYRDRLSDY